MEGTVGMAKRGGRSLGRVHDKRADTLFCALYKLGSSARDATCMLNGVKYSAICFSRNP
jgi:hypothetical protein